MSLQTVDVRFVLAKLIINKLGNQFVGYKELKTMSEKDYNSLHIHRYLSQASLETLIDLRLQAWKIPIVARTLKHHLSQVYGGLMSCSTDENKFASSMVFILFILELCRHCLECNRSKEIKSIHEFASRLIEQDGNI